MSALALALGTFAGPASPEGADRPGSPGIDSYVALGDSYTAGPLIPTTQVAGGCFRSDRNYPSLLAADLGIDAFTDVSCSGADTTDMARSQQTMLGPVAPLLAALSSDTDLVTLSVGGNDASVFGRLVTVCPTLTAQDPDGSPCRKYFGADGRDDLRDDIDDTRRRVAEVIAQIKERAPGARVVVIGYPQIAPMQGTCPDVFPLATGDYRYANQIERALNAALRQAARSQQVEYFDIFTVTRGHDVCAADPWINGQYTDPARAQSYHPFGAEMAAVARELAAYLT